MHKLYSLYSLWAFTIIVLQSNIDCSVPAIIIFVFICRRGDSQEFSISNPRFSATHCNNERVITARHVRLSSLHNKLIGRTPSAAYALHFPFPPPALRLTYFA